MPAGPPPRGARLWLFRLLAVVGLPLLVFAALEIALRVSGYGYSTGFFNRVQIGNETFLVNNEKYGNRFFPEELARFSGPIRMAEHKPGDTFRIFVLGESAAMGDPEPSFGASRYLDVLLRERFPQRKFEVVNVAITAINSHVILPIARDCAQQHGDLWIIYMGNNEMVGPFGAATVFGSQAPPLGMVRLSLAIQKTRTGQLLMALARKVRGKAASASSWGGMEMFIGNELPPDSPRKQRVYRNFQQNLRDIVGAGLRSGATVVLNTVAVNLGDCPPFASMLNSNQPPADRARFETLYGQAIAALNQSNRTEALALFDQAARLNPQYAELHYRWGAALLETTNHAAARAQLQQAVDTDALPFRTDSRINGLIRNEAAQHPGARLALLDAAELLATNQPVGVCGKETFYEHVHFNFEGNYRLARLWAEQAEAALPEAVRAKPAGPWASQQTCDRLLGLSDWNRALVLQSFFKRLSQPPLSRQFNNPKRQEFIGAELARLRAATTSNAIPLTISNFQAAIARAPGDHYLYETFAEFLQAIGDFPLATEQWKRVHEILPEDFLSYYQLGRLYALQGKWAEAETCLGEVVATHPSMIEAWYELGNVHAARQQYDRALADYQQVLRRRPKDFRAICATGKVLAKLNRRLEAIDRFRQAIELNPAYWEAHFQLGGELSFDGKTAEAEAQFAEAVRLQPGHPTSHFNLGAMLAKQRRYDEAIHEFEEALRLDPGYQNARLYLSQVKMLKANPALAPQ
jgi:tetratricopeptide (TPR) repeat protein